MSREKIAITDLRPGMYVVRPDISWIKAPLLYMEEGFISSEEEIAEISRQGYREVYHDPSRMKPPAGENEPEELPAESTEASTTQQPTVPLNEEMGQAQSIYADSFDLVKNFMESSSIGTADIAASQPYVESIIGSLDRNADALLSLAQLKTSDEYTYTHCVNVTIFAVAYAHFLNLPEDALHLVGLAALFHDYGKSAIPSEVLNAPRQLTPEELTLMRSHVLLGYERLKKLPGIAPEILQGAVQHHERHDGTGYPHKLSGKRIGVFGRIISISDNYDALVAKRVYKPSLAPTKALAIMYKMRGQAWASGWVERFIKMMGVYPVGSTVLLSTGEYGVVHAANMTFPTQPKVLVITDAHGRPVADTHGIDLYKCPDISITRPLTHAEDKDIDVEAFLSLPCNA